MLANYLKVAFRGLVRFRTYSLINMFGFAVGLAASLLVSMYVISEMTYDSFWQDADRIYRVTTTIQNTQTGITRHTGGALHSIAPLIRKEIPEAEVIARLQEDRHITLKHDSDLFEAKGFFYADATVFDIFPFQFLHGTPEMSLGRPKTVILTQSFAKKLFGDENPVGRIVETTWGANWSFEVTGVIADLSQNSHLRFEALASMETKTLARGRGGDGFLTYIKLREGVAPRQLEEQLNLMLEQHGYQRQSLMRTLRIQPLRDIHLHSDFDYDSANVGDLQSLHLLGILAIALLVIAALNYVNLSTSRYTIRLREVGVRKTLGATRAAFVRQFLGETLVLTLLSLGLALAIAEISLPWLNAELQTNLTLTGQPAWFFPVVLVFAAGIGILTGAYPALFLSGFDTASTLRGKVGTLTNAANIRRTMVGIQVITSVILLIFTWAATQQIEFATSHDVGFDVGSLVVMDNGFRPQQVEEILQNPKISGLTSSMGIPGTGLPKTGYVPEGIEKGQELSFHTLGVDYSFIDVYGLRLVKGRWFLKDNTSDLTGAFILNEAAARALGWRNPIGKRLQQPKGQRSNQDAQVIGVVRDFHFDSMRHRIEPLVIHLAYIPGLGFISDGSTARIDTKDVSAATMALRKAYTQFVPHKVPEIRYLSDVFRNFYVEEERLKLLVGLCGIVTLLLTSLGVFGLVAFTVEKRTKEIAIRKILGATVTEIAGLFAREFGMVSGFSSLVGVSISVFIVREWLSGYAYRVPLDPGMFVKAGVGVILLVIVVAGGACLRAANVRPVDALRSE